MDPRPSAALSVAVVSGGGGILVVFSISGLEIGWSSIGVSKKAVLVVVSPLTDPPSVGKPNDCSFHHGLSKADLYVDKPEAKTRDWMEFNRCQNKGSIGHWLLPAYQHKDLLLIGHGGSAYQHHCQRICYAVDKPWEEQ